jgi:hypothetical protein
MNKIPTIKEHQKEICLNALTTLFLTSSLPTEASKPLFDLIRKHIEEN